MSEAPSVRPLQVSAFASLVLAQFIVAFGSGFLLPILPSLVRHMTAAAVSIAIISRHSGFLTSVYTSALFLFAPLWGRFADSYGRKGTLLFGLGGLSATLLAFQPSIGLPFFYVLRFLGGVCASAVIPAAYAIVGDYAPSKQWRARRFAVLNVATSIGFLAGPIAGGLMAPMASSRTLGTTLALQAPFWLVAALTALAVVAVSRAVPREVRPQRQRADAKSDGNHSALLRLLILSFATGLALGSFEIGTTLRVTQVLGETPYRLALMLAECMIVMLIAQAAIFSPFVRIDSTRLLVTPALALLAISLALQPLAVGEPAMILAVAGFAGSAGVLSPVVTYWISLSRRAHIAGDLGLDSAATNLGQSVGSAGAGMLFGAAFVPNASFTVIALLVLGGLAASWRLPRLLGSA